MTDTATRPPAIEAPEPSLTERMLAENALGEVWRICYLANLFVFPIYARFEKAHDILRPEFVTLFCLAHTQPLIAQDVVDMTGLPKNTISRGVNRLLSRGLIARGAHPGDRRKASLRLTPAGRAMFERLLPEVEARRATLTEGLDIAEREELGRLLLRMARGALGRLGEDGDRPPSY